MAGIALALDLLNKNPTILLRSTLHSHGFFSAKAAVSSAASSAVVAAPFAAWAFLSKGGPQIVHCDTGVAPIEDYSSSIDKSTLQKDAVYHGTKEYTIELKPILSAFHWKTFSLTSLRFFLLSFLPLLESFLDGEDEDDFLRDSYPHIDLSEVLSKSSKQIFLETTVATTRRILERFVVHQVSRRTAWKLLKDASKSAARKAARGMPTYCYIYCVSKTTFRVHCLGVLASWMVQVGMDVYRYSIRMWNSPDDFDEYDRKKLARLLRRKVSVTTVRCCSSLILAPVGAGIGAAILPPSSGQWIGCAVGDLAGPAIVQLCSTKYGFSPRD